MQRIIEINSSVDLDELRNSLAKAHSLRITIEGTQVSFKVNGGIWSPPMGQLDPQCQVAQAIRAAHEVDDETRRIIDSGLADGLDFP